MRTAFVAFLQFGGIEGLGNVESSGVEMAALTVVLAGVALFALLGRTTNYQTLDPNGFRIQMAGSRLGHVILTVDFPIAGVQLTCHVGLQRQDTVKGKRLFLVYSKKLVQTLLLCAK